MKIDVRKLIRNNERLPLAVIIHFNWYLSSMFAFLSGYLAVEKHKSLFFCKSFQRSLLIPVYCIWLIAEITRLYVGQKGILRDKLPELAAYLLLSCFPQMFTVAYLGFLQEIILPVDVTLGTITITMIIMEVVLVWRRMRCVITRQTAMYNADERGNHTTGTEQNWRRVDALSCWQFLCEKWVRWSWSKALLTQY